MNSRILRYALFALILVAAAGYGVYWVRKTVNYEIMYKGMVQDTVREMVRPESLKPEYVKEKPKK